MPPTIGGVTIDPQGQTLTVSITPAAKVYTDAAGTTLATFPATVSSRTSYWMSAAQSYTVSVKSAQGNEIADATGNALVVDVQQGVMEGIAPIVDRPGPEDVAAVGGPPSGAAGGDLTGTYPNPTIGTLRSSITGAEQTANKGAANGYAGLGAGGYVPTGELGTGAASSSTFLRGDGSWQSVSSSGVLNSIDATASPYLVVADGKEVNDVVTTASSATITSASAAFTSAINTMVCQLLIPSRTVVDCVTNATTTITSATAAFTANDVGKTVTLNNYVAATKAYSTVAGGNLTTTIAAYVSATQVTLTAAPGWSTSTTSLVIGQSSVVGTLTFVNATTATLSGPAPFTSTGSTLRYGTDNLAALQAAATAASTAGKTLVLPPTGTNRITVKPGTGATRSVKITGDLKVSGAGKFDTTIQWVGVPTDANIQAIWEFTTTSNCRVTDHTVAGPLDPGFVIPRINAFSPSTSAVYVTGSNTHTKPVQEFERLKVTGLPGEALAFVSVGHDGDTYVRNCDFTSLSVCVQMYSASGYTKRFWWSDCYLHDQPFLTDAAGNDLTGECFYIHQNVSLHAERVKFSGNLYYAVQWQGGASGAAEFARFIGCRWENDIGNAVYTSNQSAGSTLIEGCVFNNYLTGVYSRHSTRVIGNFFNQGGVIAGPIGVTYASMGAGDIATVVGNTFNLTAGSIGQVLGIGCGGGAGVCWVIDGNTFRMTSTGATTLNGLTASTGGDIVVSNNIFYGITSGTLLHAMNTNAGVNMDVTTNRFLGVYASASAEAAVTVTGGVPGKVRLRENTFDMSSGRPWCVGNASGSTYANTVELHRNRLVTYTATPQARASHWQNGELPRGVNPTPIASAATLNFDPNYSIAHVSGTTNTSSIQLANDVLTTQGYGGARLSLIADGAWTPTAGGNIVWKTGVATVAASVGQVFVFELDSSQAVGSPAAPMWNQVA